MSDLAAWLLEQIAADEAVARRQVEMRPEWVGLVWQQMVSDPVIGGYGGQTRTRDVSTGLYVGRFAEPGRVLAECEAKRAIVALHENAHGYCERCESGKAGWDEGADGRSYSFMLTEEWPCLTLRHLAAPYGDRPGFREEWRA